MRPWLLAYSGVRIDTDEELWSLYLETAHSEYARAELYRRVGAGGWDDICINCPLHRYEHMSISNHSFISEEQ